MIICGGVLEEVFKPITALQFVADVFTAVILSFSCRCCGAKGILLLVLLLAIVIIIVIIIIIVVVIVVVLQLLLSLLLLLLSFLVLSLPHLCCPSSVFPSSAHIFFRVGVLCGLKFYHCIIIIAAASAVCVTICVTAALLLLLLLLLLLCLLPLSRRHRCVLHSVLYSYVILPQGLCQQSFFIHSRPKKELFLFI